MEIKVNFLDKLRLEAKFDDFTVVADQPIRYKGDGSAPGPFDYFLASSALCAAYFVKLYCDTRNISTENIRLSQNNIVDPENRYQQIFKIQVELPADISAKDRQGILRSIDRCTVKKVVQAGPEFVIEEVENLDADAQGLLMLNPATGANTYIAGKDLPLEQTIANMSGVLANLGIKIEIASWRNIVPHVWSLHIRDAHSPMPTPRLMMACGCSASMARYAMILRGDMARRGRLPAGCLISPHREPSVSGASIVCQCSSAGASTTCRAAASMNQQGSRQACKHVSMHPASAPVPRKLSGRCCAVSCSQCHRWGGARAAAARQCCRAAGIMACCCRRQALTLVTRAPGMWIPRKGRLPRSTRRLTCTMTTPPELCAAMACLRTV